MSLKNTRSHRNTEEERKRGHLAENCGKDQGYNKSEKVKHRNTIPRSRGCTAHGSKGRYLSSLGLGVNGTNRK